MAELNIFHYNPKNSLIHNLDSRFKLFSLMAFSIVTGISSRSTDLMVLTATFLVQLLLSKLPLKNLLMELRHFLVFIFFIILIHAFSLPGTPVFPDWSFSPTIPGLISGCFFGWKLILIITYCLIITGTTLLSSFRYAIEWFLRPVPFISETRVGTMFSLTFGLLPVIFDQTLEMTEAQQSRCIQVNRNPLKRINALLFPLILRTLLRVDEMALAMESRCYSDERTQPAFKTKLSDWIFLFCTFSVLTLVLFHPYR